MSYGPRRPRRTRLPALSLRRVAAQAHRHCTGNRHTAPGGSGDSGVATATGKAQAADEEKSLTRRLAESPEDPSNARSPVAEQQHALPAPRPPAWPVLASPSGPGRDKAALVHPRPGAATIPSHPPPQAAELARPHHH